MGLCLFIVFTVAWNRLEGSLHACFSFLRRTELCKTVEEARNSRMVCSRGYVKTPVVAKAQPQIISARGLLAQGAGP